MALLWQQIVVLAVVLAAAAYLVYYFVWRRPRRRRSDTCAECSLTVADQCNVKEGTRHGARCGSELPEETSRDN